MCNDSHDSVFADASFVLITCFFLCMGFVGLWFSFFLLGAEYGYALHSRWFDLGWRDYVWLNYVGMAFAKICGIVFFLFPYFGIRLLLRKRKKGTHSISRK